MIRFENDVSPFSPPPRGRGRASEGVPAFITCSGDGLQCRAQIVTWSTAGGGVNKNQGEEYGVVGGRVMGGNLVKTA